MILRPGATPIEQQRLWIHDASIGGSLALGSCSGTTFKASHHRNGGQGESSEGGLCLDKCLKMPVTTWERKNRTVPSSPTASKPTST